MVKNLHAHVGDARDVGLTWIGRSLEQEMATPSTILAWDILQTEEPSKPQSMVCEESDTTEQLSTLQCTAQCILFHTPHTLWFHCQDHVYCVKIASG